MTYNVFSGTLNPTHFTVSVGLSVRKDISGTIRAIFTKFLCMFPMSVARSSSDMFMIGRIANCWEGVIFPFENALSAGKGMGLGVHGAGEVCYLRLPCLFSVSSLLCP